MSLRVKLFTLVVGIFIGIFLITQVIDDYLTTSRLWRVESDIQSIIKHRAETQAESLEKYLNERVDWHMAAIDSLLGRVLSYEWVHERFAPDPRTDKYNNWLASATLIQMNKGLDLVQSTTGRTVNSLIIVDEPPPRLARPLATVEGIRFFIVESEVTLGKWEGPFVAIPFPFNKGYTITANYALNPQLLTDPKDAFYFLYPIDAILNANLQQFYSRMDQFPGALVDMASSVNSREQVVAVLNQVYQYLLEAQQTLRAKPEIVDRFRHSQLQARLKEYLPKFAELQEKDIEARSDLLKDVETRFNQLEMMWQLALITETGVYNYDPFDQSAPIGITHLPDGRKEGQMIEVDDVFFRYPILCTGNDSCGPNPHGKNIKVPPITVVYQQETKRLFLGNMIDILGKGESGETEYGALLLGVDASDIVKSLALATDKTALFVSNEHILKAFDKNGNLIDKGLDKIPINEMLGHRSGIVEYQDGQKFFYVHLDLATRGDIHFFVLTPEQKEFQVLDFLKYRTQELSENIDFQTNVLALLALIVVILLVNNVVRKITRPIVKLSEATQFIGEGKLDEVNLPEVKERKGDEVQTLYKSFNHMVKELREKEKVKGVLNKVVSPTIAEEILQGNVKLGGEEKVATVLFADIRNFTTMTERMDPKHLIELLNNCMTKISDVIDKHGGVIDKYVGDEVMALFGAPIVSEDSAYKAVLAALEIRDVILDWNKERKKAGDREIEMGIGIHTGVVVAGNMGAENRLNYTVLGANVNLASRLCSTANGMEIIISDSTLNSPFVSHNIETEKLQPVELKGFSKTVEVFSVIRSKTPPPTQTLQE